MADYDYNAAGFDNFLSRSIDGLNQANLDSPGPISTSQAYDRTQVSGTFGDTFRVGNISFNGAQGNITMSDDSGTDILLIGNDNG